jgi:hypothetical protein
LIRQLAAKANLELAWRRITTGGNQQYKRLFRHLYFAYEVALEDNLKDLRQRILGGTFDPSQPESIYLPKSSGLHRPLRLLHLEDQIVLQAFANMAAKRLYKKRAPLQFKVVFSNILQSDRSIFFFKRWQDTYAVFNRQIANKYNAGLRWVADFDLAAFYDTISHGLLLKTIYPKTSMDVESEWILKCLRTWSSAKISSSHGHGLPQGPIASDFLAECFLLPIDLALRKSEGYIRYVDDFRLFGRNEDDVRAAVIILERYCRERGLIPQSGKFTIKRAQSIKDALGMLPSIADPHRTAGSETITRNRARAIFLSGIGGKPYRVKDKTRLRYVLFRAAPDPKLLALVLRLIPHHPEHADAFFNYLAYFDFRKQICRLCLNLVENNPYPYVRGESWFLLARYLHVHGAIVGGAQRVLTMKAIEIAKARQGAYFMEKWGACNFLAVSEVVGGARHSRFLKFQSPLLQSFLAQVLPGAAFSRREAAHHFLQRSSFEPGLSICGRMSDLSLTLQSFGLSASSLPSQVRNTLCELGVIPTRGATVDPIAEILKTRYKVPSSKSWRQFLGNEYVHTLGLLKQAEATFFSGPSFWLACQNSFNHAIFLALQAHLGNFGHAAAVTMRDRNGQLIDFGVMLDRNNPFSRNCPTVANCFRDMNTRRNHLPVSHPYDKKTSVRSRHLQAQERNRFVNKLQSAYPDFVTLMP